LLKFSAAVNGVNPETITYYSPDSGNAGQPLENISNVPVQLQYPIAAPITVTFFAAYLTTSVPAGASVTVSLLRNNVAVGAITFPAGDPGTQRVITIPSALFVSGALLSVQIEVVDFPTETNPFIVSSTAAYV
jgi:hypothetical protein